MVRVRSLAAVLAGFLLFAGAGLAQKFFTYIGDIGPDFVLVAWGTTAGTNTIGRTSSPYGKVAVKVGSTEMTVTDRNYAIVRGLSPDKEYHYELLLNGHKIGDGQIRTWPLKSDKLCFFVIGDYGSGEKVQASVGKAMWEELLKRWGGEYPVRFVITVGDNLYGRLGFTLRFSKSGAEDRDWGSKFFEPYEPVLARLPFYPSLGNHDGNETENRDDLLAYLDNFYFPGGQAARYYRFSYGGLADFFALDSSTNSEKGPPAPMYLESGEQYKWAARNIGESQVPWKIPYFHNPPFNAGPRHPAASAELAHFLKLFKDKGVKVVFSGHEHNFQFSEKNDKTGGIRYIVSGAGGELRTGDVRNAMESAQIEGWSAQLHYLVVEISGKEMRIFPQSYEPMTVVDKDGRHIEMPLKVTVP